MLPVKWMPPEAFMEGIFTCKTDTWYEYKLHNIYNEAKCTKGNCLFKKLIQPVQTSYKTLWHEYVLGSKELRWKFSKNAALKI